MKQNKIFSTILAVALCIAGQQSFAQGAIRDGWAFNSFNNTGANARWDLNYWRVDEGQAATYLRRFGVRHQILSPEPYEDSRIYFQNAQLDFIDEFGWGRGYFVGTDPLSSRLDGGIGMYINQGFPILSSMEINFSLSNPGAEELVFFFTPDFDVDVAGDYDYSYISNYTDNLIEFTTIGERAGRYDSVTVQAIGPNLYAYEQGDAPTLYENLSQPWHWLSNESYDFYGNGGVGLDYVVVLSPGASQTYRFIITVRRG